MPRFPKTPWWLLGLLAMTGCASSPKFQCPTPNGVACMSVTEVYQATEYSADVHRSDVSGDGSIAVTETAPPAWMAPTGTPSVVEPSADLQIDDGSIVLTDEPIATVKNESLLSDARVVRVWVAPWEDTRGDLHLAGYVFSEVKGRRWRLGNAVPANRPVLRLLQSTPDSPPPTAAPVGSPK